jgi:COP9 signalosome complex subunit 6
MCTESIADDGLDKIVYKQPQLDLVGWFALSPATGPEPRHLPIHVQIQNEYNLENAILLLFHPELVPESSKMGGKLPLTLYEGVWSADNANAMDVDGSDRSPALKFRELPYSVETGEAEMISLDFVARGGGNATAVAGSAAQSPAAKDKTPEDKKGKGKAGESEAQTNGVEKNYLTPEDDERTFSRLVNSSNKALTFLVITSLTARMNAIKMLQSRLDLLQSYLKSLPPSYLTDASLPLDPANSSINHPILRSISALLGRLPLLTPSDVAAYSRESQQSKSDVELISLLSSLTQAAKHAKELGRKWNVVENAKLQGRRGGFDPEVFRRGASDFGHGGEMEWADGAGRGGILSAADFGV